MELWCDMKSPLEWRHNGSRWSEISRRQRNVPIWALQRDLSLTITSNANKRCISSLNTYTKMSLFRLLHSNMKSIEIDFSINTVLLRIKAFPIINLLQKTPWKKTTHFRFTKKWGKTLARETEPEAMDLILRVIIREW